MREIIITDQGLFCFLLNINNKVKTNERQKLDLNLRSPFRLGINNATVPEHFDV